ncbi:MAG: preprotein translocase subunit SecG [Chloroflexia bacterium]
MLRNALNLIEIVISATLVTVIILQSKGSGFGGIFGGRDMLSPLHTRRGLEKTLFQITIGLVVVFLLLSLVSSLLP